MSMSLAGKTLFITGASRGIGKAIALRAARDGANVVIAAKTNTPHPKLEGTVHSAAQEVEAVGGSCLPCIVDVRDEEQVQNAVDAAVKKFGGIDIVVNNASAISLTGTLDTAMKRYDLMHSVNTRGTFLVSKLCIPHLKKSSNAHILNISPPLLMEPRWFKTHVAYTMAKFGMSMCVLGMADELKSDNICVNALWPKTAIATAAMEMLGGKDITKNCRKPTIMADAAYAILTGRSTGKFYIDEKLLREHGVTNFDEYAVDKNEPLAPDFFLPEEELKSFAKNELFQLFYGNEESSQSTPISVESVFNKIKSSLNEELVNKTKGIYAFHITGPENEVWFVDMKNGSGAVGKGQPPAGSADCIFTMELDSFIKMFTGSLKPTSAFMSGKMKLKGDMALAMKLERLMSAMKSKL
ncbi:hydroxysteroid dehydrogenase-like protein 2 [Trichonephila inaurata madagascariensis]|uniref:Hydroxysteroid dehydrogenase-like protein 2 n=1 Tax=Trichonephila inaurata madagascariensis TaxID=2747483 RepID=A0A8X7C3R8_9ARAC|nr:hydroxysteroid dehydrogenase-like protein 2 [Trichonephila inaurata madagascariensis]